MMYMKRNTTYDTRKSCAVWNIVTVPDMEAAPNMEHTAISSRVTSDISQQSVKYFVKRKRTSIFASQFRLKICRPIQVDYISARKRMKSLESVMISFLMKYVCAQCGARRVYVIWNSKIIMKINSK